MKYRKLRIAWSVVWGIVAVLLLVLWMRSYSWVDHVFITKYFGDKETVWIEQKLGRISVTFISQSRPSSRRAIWHQSERLENEIPYPTRNALGFGIRRFGEDTGEPGFDLIAPHWFYVSVVAFVAAASWIRCPRRSSLRTLLIPIMRSPKLGIAWSVFCGLAAALLIALWAWSYRDVIYDEVAQDNIKIISGRVIVNDAWIPTVEARSKLEAQSQVYLRTSRPNPSDRLPSDAPRLSVVPAGRYGYMVRLWQPTLVVTLLGATPWIPWLPWRFSLRTLLIATTLVAVLLGLIVWAVGK